MDFLDLQLWPEPPSDKSLSKEAALHLPWCDAFYYSVATPLVRGAVSRRVVGWSNRLMIADAPVSLEAPPPGGVTVAGSDRDEVTLGREWFQGWSLFAVPWRDEWPERMGKATDALWLPWHLRRFAQVTLEQEAENAIQDRVYAGPGGTYDWLDEEPDDLMQELVGPEFGPRQDVWEAGENRGFHIGLTVLARSDQ